MRNFFYFQSINMNTDFILELYQKPLTVFTLKEISLLFPKISYQSLKDRLSYAVSKKKLLRLKKGVYSKIKFEPLELANKIYTPSYISLETVLQKEGIIFQNYLTIFVASYLTRKINVFDYQIQYRKIKNEILFNKEGIEELNGYFIASKERAFLDAIFLYKNYHFDNLKIINWEKVFQLIKIYRSKVLEKRVKEYYQLFKKENV